jgi:hypothetical protein
VTSIQDEFNAAAEEYAQRLRGQHADDRHEKAAASGTTFLEAAFAHLDQQDKPERPQGDGDDFAATFAAYINNQEN